MSEVNYTITGWAGVLVGFALFAWLLAWLFVLPTLGLFWLFGWLA
jgi:hypothetical protein